METQRNILIGLCWVIIQIQIQRMMKIIRGMITMSMMMMNMIMKLMRMRTKDTDDDKMMNMTPW